jgi:transcriptional regulator with XRE-family HTH domain
MTKMADEPLSYWIAVARMGFENDFHRLFDELGIPRMELAQRVGASPAYVSKVLNGTRGNFQLRTMAKWARAIGAIVQIRLIKESNEVVRVVDYETAGVLDDALGSQAQSSVARPESSNVLYGDFESQGQERGFRRVNRASLHPSSNVTADYKEAPGG